jgi:hypothetical protein
MPDPPFLDPRGKADPGKSGRATERPAIDARGLSKRLGLAPDAQPIDRLRREAPRIFGPPETIEPLRSEDLPPGLRSAAEQHGYGRLLRSGAERLTEIGFGRPEFGRDPSVGGDAIFGVENFDERFWSVEPDPKTRSRLVLLPKKRPSDAIDAIFAKQSVWQVDCALFVQILHLNALKETLGRAAFDMQQGGMILRPHDSTGIDRRLYYQRSRPDQQFWRSDGRLDQRPIAQILQDIPIGTRVMWTNRQVSALSPQHPELDAYRRENTVKVGSDQYAAIGFGRRRTFSRADLELSLAKVTTKAPNAAYIAENVFIMEIEEYRLPFDRLQGVDVKLPTR